MTSKIHLGSGSRRLDISNFANYQLSFMLNSLRRKSSPLRRLEITGFLSRVPTSGNMDFEGESSFKQIPMSVPA